jgi:hypothetical protein
MTRVPINVRRHSMFRRWGALPVQVGQIVCAASGGSLCSEVGTIIPPLTPAQAIRALVYCTKPD